jgi:hypothetical protein
MSLMPQQCLNFAPMEFCKETQKLESIHCTGHSHTPFDKARPSSSALSRDLKSLQVLGKALIGAPRQAAPRSDRSAFDACLQQREHISISIRISRGKLKRPSSAAFPLGKQTGASSRQASLLTVLRRTNKRGTVRQRFLYLFNNISAP